MHYLASWRMQVASQKLRTTNASLAQVAETRDCRLRLRGRFLPRVQEGVWCGASNVATFEQLGLGYVEANPRLLVRATRLVNAHMSGSGT
jgi:hypothetical protein